MKPQLIRQILIISFLGLLGLGFFVVYLYQSRDVKVLIDKYPHVEREGVLIKDKKPFYWISLSQMSVFAKSAIVLSEDWAFYQHQGIDFKQLEEVLRSMGTVKKIRGASTISQQTIKNIFLTEDRTILRKLHELILTYKMESTISKDRILEIYLNSIEYGPGIIGLKSAAKHYFKKRAIDLSPRESAFIALMLPSPIRYYTSFKKKKLTPFATKRIQEILEKMRMAKVISPEVYQAELNSKFDWELD